MSGCEVTVPYPRALEAQFLYSLYAWLCPPVAATMMHAVFVSPRVLRNKLHGMGVLGMGSSSSLPLGNRIRGKDRASFSA